MNANVKCKILHRTHLVSKVEGRSTERSALLSL